MSKRAKRKKRELLETEKKTDGHFIKLYNDIMQGDFFTNLSEAVLWCFLYNLSSNENGVYAKRSSLAKALRLSKIQVQRLLNAFVERDILHRTQRKGKTSVYRLLMIDHPDFKEFRGTGKFVEIGEDPYHNDSTTEQVENKDPYHFDTPHKTDPYQNDSGLYNNKRLKPTNSFKKTELNGPAGHESPPFPLDEARFLHNNGQDQDSCPDEVKKYVAYWEEQGFTVHKRQSKTFRDAIILLKQMISGEYFAERKLYTGYKLTFDDFAQAVDNYALALTIKYVDGFSWAQRNYTLKTFLFNPDARKIHYPFKYFLDNPPKPFTILIRDIDSVLTRALVSKYAETIGNGYRPTNTDYEKFKMASNLLSEYFTKNGRRFVPAITTSSGKVDFLFEAIKESLPSDFRLWPGMLCSTRTWNTAIPMYVNSKNMMTNTAKEGNEWYHTYMEHMMRESHEKWVEAQD